MPLEQDFAILRERLETNLSAAKLQRDMTIRDIRCLEAHLRILALEENLFMRAEIEKETETAKDDIAGHK
jgi:hypothetical protein